MAVCRVGATRSAAVPCWVGSSRAHSGLFLMDGVLAFAAPAGSRTVPALWKRLRFYFHKGLHTRKRHGIAPLYRRKALAGETGSQMPSAFLVPV